MTDALRRYAVELGLVAVAAVWGATFVMVKDAVEHYPLFAFLGWRFLIAVVAFSVMFPRSLRRFGKGTLGAGLLAGALLTAGYIFQTWGLQGTSASKAAFITGMFVVITPVMQVLVLRRVPRLVNIAGVLIAVAGLWLLTGGSPGGWNAGDTRVLGCAIAYSAHMIVLGSVGRRHDVGALTLVQLATCAVTCGVVSAAVERPALPSGVSLWTALLVTGVLASAVAFAVQTYAQRHLSPTRTALILISEPAFGGLFGWLLAGEVLGPSGLAGSGLILGGMVLSEVAGALRGRRASDTMLEPSIEGMSVPVIESGEGDGGAT